MQENNTPQPEETKTDQVKMPPKDKVQVRVRKKPKKKKITFGGVMAVFLFLVIVAAGVILYMDLFGSNALLAGLLGWDKPTEEQLQELSTRQAEVEALESGSNTTALELDQLDKALDQREADIARKEDELANKEANLEERERVLSDREYHISEAAGMYKAMDPEKAAAALGGMEYVSDITGILVSMEYEDAAAILDEMETEIATKVAEELMKSYEKTDDNNEDDENASEGNG